jgi:Protein of unknown function (DUF3574)
MLLLPAPLVHGKESRAEGTMAMRFSRIFLASTAALMAFGVQSAAAQDLACPLAGQKTMLVVQLFFGQRTKEGHAVSSKEWRSFLARTVTPRFPEGLTVYDGDGQWMNPETHAIIREKTKVVVIATEDTPAVRARIDELSGIYRARFHQQSVGSITSPGCAAF